MSIRLTNGQLSLSGTAGNDTIKVRRLADNQIEARVNNEVKVFKADEVKSVDIQGHNGKDEIIVEGNFQEGGFDPKGIEFNIKGGNGNDTIDLRQGLAAKFRAEGGNGNDTLYGSAGKDVLWGDRGNDTIYGGDELDLIWGGAGDDLIDGEGGSDLILGNEGNDTLLGGSGYDSLIGGEGNDTLTGGEGIDRFEGGEGEDTFNMDSEDILTDLEFLKDMIQFAE